MVINDQNSRPISWAAVLIKVFYGTYCLNPIKDIVLFFEKILIFKQHP